MSSSELAERAVEARLGMDDSDVRESRLREDERDVARRELALERIQVVELDDPCRHGRIDRRAEVPAPRLHDAVRAERRERLVDGAVVAPVENEDGRSARQVTCEPNDEAVGIGRGQCELPGGDTESARQLVRHPKHVLARQHERDALGRLLGHRLQRRLRCMPRHRPRVAEAEVDVLVAVDVDESCPLRLAHEHGKASRPLPHPVHGDALEERRPRTLGQLARTRMRIDEARLLARLQLGKADDRHGSESMAARNVPLGW